MTSSYYERLPEHAQERVDRIVASSLTPLGTRRALQQTVDRSLSDIEWFIGEGIAIGTLSLILAERGLASKEGNPYPSRA